MPQPEHPRYFLNFFKKLRQKFLFLPHNEAELLEVIKKAAHAKVLGQETLKMMEGVLAVSSMQVRDIMVPRSQMVCIEKNQAVAEFLPIILKASHLRFPVIDGNKDDVLGVLHVKEFLKYYIEHQNGDFNMMEILRPAYFVPESKRLDAILNEFKSSHNHLAVVVDEYGGIAGLLTIEDVLEEIVGDIEDEFDTTPDVQIHKLEQHRYQIHPLTPIEEFNIFFNAALPDDEVDTIGGLIMRELEAVPKMGERVRIGAFEFIVTKSDLRRVLMLEVVVHGG